MFHHLLKRSNLLLVGLLVVVGIAAMVAGYLTLGSNLFVVLGAGLLVVGLAKLFDGPQPLFGLLMMTTGGAMWFGRDFFPSLTIADALSFVGGP